MKIHSSLKSYLNQSLTKVHWSRIGIYPHHGIAVPLFSIISNNSAGIGEFYDLLPFIKWLHEIGMDILQLLPLNDRGDDPSPYNALSSKALDPIHISLYALDYLNEKQSLLDKLSELKKLSTSKRIQYQKVKYLKIAFLKEYFNYFFFKFKNEENYLNFQSKNPWLGVYALYKLLREKNDNKGWFFWDDKIKNPIDFEALIQKYKDKIEFYIFLQFISFKQLSYVKEYASEHSVLIKGDIPILLSADSVDVWIDRKLFDCKYFAGAPPDAYNTEGQNWGFPVYNWKELEKEQFFWFKQRLSVASSIYHLYRIDHVVGFFRIWVIPKTKKPIDGFYKPKNYHLWPHLGKKLLKMLLTSSTMLPIAEDLGTVPNYVPQILKEMGIAGTKIMRWERRWDEDSNFIDIKDYQPISLTSVSTHDSETLHEWWEKYPDEAKLYAKSQNIKYTPLFNNKLRFKILYDSHQSASIFHINLLQEYLAFFPELVWDNYLDERINIPGTNSSSNWTYRFKAKLEDIVFHKKLKTKMKELIKNSI